MATDLSLMIDSLSRPEAYPHPTGAIVVHQTHISVVFLAGPFAYKIKKPVSLGFLDFSTLEKRKHFCEEEVRLNRRLAPDVYLDVVPITWAPGTSTGARVNGNPATDVVEWAVKMVRLPAEATLEARLQRGEITSQQVCDLATRLAAFHRQAAGNSQIAEFGRFEIVARNVRENITQAELGIGTTVSLTVFERVQSLTATLLEQHQEVIDRRAAQGVPRDTHGDLRLEHIYWFPDKSPHEWVIIDCIEFSDRFRYADPVADLAFLAMDLAFQGRRDLVEDLAEAYFHATGDQAGRALLPLYTAYRAVVRAKVEGIERTEREIAATERAAATARARAHWLLALSELEAPGHRPALLIVAGLPGVGKSTLARALAATANFNVLRSDVVRKEIAQGATGASIYTPQWTEKTYLKLLTLAEQLLWQGNRVVIDANMRDDAWRLKFLALARTWAVPILFVHCEADLPVVRARLAARQQDASDADWATFQELEATWQPLSDPIRAITLKVNTSGDLSGSEDAVLARLREMGLASSK